MTIMYYELHTKNKYIILRWKHLPFRLRWVRAIFPKQKSVHTYACLFVSFVFVKLSSASLWWTFVVSNTRQCGDNWRGLVWYSRARLESHSASKRNALPLYFIIIGVCRNSRTSAGTISQNRIPIDLIELTHRSTCRGVIIITYERLRVWLRPAVYGFDYFAKSE